MTVDKRLLQLEDALQLAKQGKHRKIENQDKKLITQKKEKLNKAKQLKDARIADLALAIDADKAAALEEFEREKRILQDKLVHELVEKQRRQTKVEAPELRAVTRKMKQLRGDTNNAPQKAMSKRDQKMAAFAIPLRLGEVEEDFEAMSALVSVLAPHADVDLDIEVAPSKKMQPVDAVRPTRPDPFLHRTSKREHFDFKGKPRSEVSGARITVWYEEEHGDRKMDVPYQGVVSSCDPREGLYVKFEGFSEEMLITNEDDWRWGSHSNRPPEPRGR